MESVLAVIIAVSIAYNFHAIWKSDKHIETFETLIETVEI